MTAASPPPAECVTSLADRTEALRAALAAIRDPQARLAWAVEQARRRPHLPDPLRCDAHRVQGCQVRLWLVQEFREGRCWFQTDSDAVTLRALVGKLCQLANGATPGELAAFDADVLQQAGLLRQLAESRRATVLRVADQMREFARQHAA